MKYDLIPPETMVKLNKLIETPKHLDDLPEGLIGEVSNILISREYGVLYTVVFIGYGGFRIYRESMEVV